MTRMKIIRDRDGHIINIGDWDYQITRQPVMVDVPEKILDEETGQVSVEYHKEPAFQQLEDGSFVARTQQVFGNPLPEGAYEDEADIVVGWDGGLYEITDPRKEQPNT